MALFGETVMSFPCSEFDKEVLECLNTATGMVKNCANSAVSHIDKAWKLKDIDKEMAIFRAITAEEEMATAIFIALKNRKYNNAGKLKHRSHPYKQGLYPFLSAIWKFLNPANTSPVRIQLYVTLENGKKLLRLRVLLHGGLHLTPDPPLQTVAMADDKREYDFQKELDDFAIENKKENILQYIKDIASLRNRLLYANSSGIPSINEEVSGTLTERINKVLDLLRVLCLIFPYEKKASLPQQCINVYLNMMNDVKSEDFL